MEDCFREALKWPSGPELCVPHREAWAAEHEEEVDAEERKAWRDRNVHTDPQGERFTTWPKNWVVR